MVVSFPSLSIASQGRYFPGSITGIDQVLSALCHHALVSEAFLSIFTTPETRQAAIATTVSNNAIVAGVKKSVRHNQCSETPGKR